MSAILLFMRNALALPQTRYRRDAATTVLHTRVGDGRLYALDLARFLAMVFMMQGHVLDALVSRTEMSVTEFPWNLWHLIRGYTAPVFLMVSGAVHAFATKRNSDGTVRNDVLAKRIRWAFTIVGIGYLITFPASRVWDLPFVPEQNWNNFLAVNILQLTGATMLLFVLVVASTKSVKQMGSRGLIAAVVMLAFTPIIQHAHQVEWLPRWLGAYLTSGHGSIFPLFPFAAYLFVGLYVGSKLAAISNEQRDNVLLRNGWRYGAAIAGIGFVLQEALRYAGVPGADLDGPMSVPLFISRVGVVLIVFSAAVLVLHHTWNMRRWYSLFGTKSLWIYIIHLLVLFGTPWTSSIGRTHYHSVSTPVAILLAAAIIGLTLVCAWTFDWYSKQPWSARWQRWLVPSAYIALLIALLV